MKLVTFRSGNENKVGVLLNEGSSVVDLCARNVATDMLDLIERFDSVCPQIKSAIRGAAIPTASVELLAPIPVPRRNLFCVGKNYREHAVEFGKSGFDSGATGGTEIPEFPIIFTKPPSSVIGPGKPIESGLDPSASVDYEAELAVIVGRGGRVSSSDDPMSFVFGYTIVNDVTSRELQKRHKQWILGKGIDTFAPMGPSIVTADEMPDLSKSTIRLWVDGQLRQSASIGDLIFDVPTLIQTIGRSITLQPGDIIATGTPVGVGIGFKPPRYLQPGQKVRIEISSLGVLENPVL